MFKIYHLLIQYNSNQWSTKLKLCINSILIIKLSNHVRIEYKRVKQTLEFSSVFFPLTFNCITFESELDLNVLPINNISEIYQNWWYISRSRNVHHFDCLFVRSLYLTNNNRFLI